MSAPAPPPAGPKPKVDDQYFFDFSKSELADKAISRRDEAADRLQTLVTWLWGIYTGAAAIGFALAEKRLSLEITLLVASASASLIAVYWIAAWVRMPRVVNFDPRSPDDIREAYADLVLTKQRRLNLGVACSVVAATLVAVSLIVVSQPAEAEEAEEPELSMSAIATALSGEGVGRRLAVTTTLEAGVEVEVTVLEGEQDLNEERFLTDDDGRLQVSLGAAPVESEESTADAGDGAVDEAGGATGRGEIREVDEGRASGEPAEEEPRALRVRLRWESSDGHGREIVSPPVEGSE